MATTLEKFAGARRGNYCTLPTVDVEILTDASVCEKCGTEVVYDPKAGTYSGKWVHAQPATEDHFVAPRTRCSYCGTQDPSEVTYVQAAYSDEVRCTRCGGVNGFGIGD